MCGYDLYGPMSQSSLVQFIRQRNRFIIYSVQVVQTFSILGNHLTHKSIQFVIVTVLLSRRRSLAPPPWRCSHRTARLPIRAYWVGTC